MLKGTLILIFGYFLQIGASPEINTIMGMSPKDITSTSLLLIGIYFLYKDNKDNKAKIEDLNKEFKDTCIKTINEVTKAVEDLRNAISKKD